jgi:hypothetical protein
MKMTVFWDVAPCSLVDAGQRFRGAYCLHLKRRSISIRLQGVTPQKTVIFIQLERLQKVTKTFRPVYISKDNSHYGAEYGQVTLDQCFPTCGSRTFKEFA